MTDVWLNLDNTDHSYVCKECGRVEVWSNRGAAKAASVWHVYENHRKVWDGLIDRGPVDPRPETLGWRTDGDLP